MPKSQKIVVAVVWIGGLFFFATMYRGFIALEQPVVHNVIARAVERI